MAALFAPQEREEAERLLAKLDAGDAASGSTPESMERLWFAALRVSGGTLAGLREALQLARVDWRDLLVSAGFGYDVAAHLSWRPRAFDSSVRAAWRDGAALAGVEYAPRARVRIVSGKFKEQRAMVVGLLALEPEPRFRVRTDAGRETAAWQSWLAGAG